MNRVPLEPPPTLSDERLAKLSAEGIDSAFAMLVLRHRRSLVCHCAELVGRADAEEVVQEALLRAYLALVRGESVNRVGPWLRTIAHNLALNLLRARASRPVVSHEEPAPARPEGDALERRESLRAVIRAVGQLPERQRQALVMRELEGRSYAEIEARLNTSNGAVRQLLSRARAAVRERLDTVAGLVPGIRWVVGGGGGGATAVRLGALSGGCAVTIKLCTAVVLPSVLAPGVAWPSAPRGDRHHVSAPTSAAGSQAYVARQPLSTRTATVSPPRSAAARPRLWALSPVKATQGKSTGRSQRGGWSRTNATASRPGVARHGIGRSAPSAAGSGPGSARAPESPAPRMPLEMGPNTGTPGGSSGSPGSASSGSQPGQPGGSAPPQGSQGGSAGSQLAASSGQQRRGSGTTMSPGGSGGQPQSATGSG